MKRPAIVPAMALGLLVMCACQSASSDRKTTSSSTGGSGGGDETGGEGGSGSPAGTGGIRATGGSGGGTPDAGGAPDAGGGAEAGTGTGSDDAATGDGAAATGDAAPTGDAGNRGPGPGVVPLPGKTGDYICPHDATHQQCCQMLCECVNRICIDSPKAKPGLANCMSTCLGLSDMLARCHVYHCYESVSPSGIKDHDSHCGHAANQVNGGGCPAGVLP